jgi:hypothetical protein
MENLWKKKVCWDILLDIVDFLKIYCLKGQCHEIFDPPFFRQSITPRLQIDTLKYFWILFRIRRDIRP